MSERNFRIIQGLYILLALYFELDLLILAYLVVIAIEGLTNWRIPLVLNRLRFGKWALASDSATVSTGSLDSEAHSQNAPQYKFDFEAERVLRLVIFTLLIFTVLIFPESGWFFPWFIGASLFIAGVTNVCPMVMLFRYLGFR